MKKPDNKRVSFKSTLLRTFAITSVAPILAIGLFSVFNIIKTLRRNTDTLMKSNLLQIDNNIQITLDAYEDLEYQIYTNDDVVEWIRRIDEGQDVPATVNQLRRYMNGLLNTKEYIRAITVITEGGSVITYDTMTAVSTDSSWIDNFSMDVKAMYEEVTADYKNYTYPTEYGTSFANKDYYLFHLAHRIINYRKINDRIGMVIVSLDEELLPTIYASDNGGNDRCTYLTDENGRIISIDSKDKSAIGTMVDLNCKNAKKQEAEFVKHSSINKRWALAYSQKDDVYGWNVVSVMDDSDLRRTLAFQGLLVAGIASAILALVIFLSVRITQILDKDIATVASGMERAQEGDLTTKIEINQDMPVEIESMAGAYNEMIEKLAEANEKEKEANRKQQEAQIAALEAQINPHFLYNTLDTINWMAIEKDEFDISNAINALATILRYAIAKSNAKVTVKDETEWLKKYIFLQQFRLKDKFECELDVDSDLLEDPIHKLLMQPFIENAIIHGFEDSTGDAIIRIKIAGDNDRIIITISDNGKGMPQESVDQINTGNIEGKDRTHIGMGNVITRMRMYYGSEASVKASSELGKGTVITLTIPRVKRDLL